jgi:glycosyltransferase involved in cell wall biosynthesis
MIKCFEQQTYPKDRIEWVIIDDGTDPIVDLVTHIKQVKYTYYKEKMLLGKKRNLMHNKCVGDIIIYMDDDDYYPPDRISHAVKTLQDNPSFLIAGCSEMYVYFDSRQKMYRCGPYKEYHSTAATFAFRRELLRETSYNNENALAEEKHFLKNYTIPLKQLDSLKSIIVFSHKHNSLNKERLLDNLELTRTVETDIRVDDYFIDDSLKQFYTSDMNRMLETYEPGKPEHKPELLKQMKLMEEDRNRRMQEQSRVKAPVEANVELVKQHYENLLANKTYLINELLKKVKYLMLELDQYKK